MSKIDYNKKIYIYGFFFISIFGTLLHFLYDFSGNIIFSPISAVNESVWEHLKIAIMPTFLYAIIEYFKIYKKDKYNLFFSLLIKSLTIIFVITIGYYLYTFILNRHLLVIDVFLFYFSIFVAQIIGYKISRKEYNLHIEKVSKQLCIIVILLFVLFTYLPPNLDIFKDEVTNTYGVFKNKY